MTSDFIPLLEPSPSDAPTRRSSQRKRSAHQPSPQSSREDDRTLIHGLLNRDPAAWRDFIQRYERLIASQILAVCRETDTAAASDLIEDCGADVMAALIHGDMSGLRKFEGRSKLSTWLVIVVRRTTLAFLRKRERDTAAAIQPDSRLDLQSIPDRRTDTNVNTDDDQERLRTCLQELSTSDRQLLALYFEQKWSYAEIATKLQITENAVGPKLYRARSRLKKLMTRSSPDNRNP